MTPRPSDAQPTRSPIASWILSTAREAAWAPTLVFLVHVVASLPFDLYRSLPFLDIWMHFLGGVAIAWFFRSAAFHAARVGLLGPRDPRTHAVLVIGLVGTATVAWEFAEFISDKYVGTTAQGDLADTLLDMFLGIAGGVTLLIGLEVIGRRRSQA